MIRFAVLPLAILLAAAVPARADANTDARISRLENQVRQLLVDLAVTRAELAQVRAAVVGRQNAPAPIPVQPAYTPPPGLSAQDRYRASQRQSKLSDIRRLTDQVKSESDWLRYYRQSKRTDSSSRYHEDRLEHARADLDKAQAEFDALQSP